VIEAGELVVAPFSRDGSSLAATSSLRLGVFDLLGFVPAHLSCDFVIHTTWAPSAVSTLPSTWPGFSVDRANGSRVRRRLRSKRFSEYAPT